MTSRVHASGLQKKYLYRYQSMQKWAKELTDIP
jgi:hypothetical protein